MTSGERRRMIAPYERRNNSVFSAFLNWGNNVINGGRLFQTFAAATGKAHHRLFCDAIVDREVVPST